MSSLTIKHLWLALALLVYSILAFSAPRIGSRLNHPPTMNGDQVFAGVKNQTLRFVLSGATDLDKNPLSYVLVDGPSSGTLKNCLNNTSVLACEFTPNPEFRGSVTFSYKAFDGTSYSANVNRVTLKIDLENHAPVVGTNQDLSLKNDTSFKFNLSKGTDPDGDQIFYKLVSHNGSGTLKNCLSGTSSLECEYIPATGVNETVNIIYKVSDGLLESSQTATVKLRVGNVNHAPVMKGDQGFGTTRFTLAGASDEDKDTLTYSLVNPATLPELKNCLNGTSSLNCEYVPTTKGKGSVTFTYKANDGKEDSLNVSKVTINYDSGTPVNNPPVANFACSIIGSTVNCNASLSYDSDGMIQSYEWNFGDGKTATGAIVNHSYDQGGSYSIILKVRDNLGSESFAIQNVQIMVNTPPVATFDCVQKSRKLQCSSTSTDPDGQIAQTYWLVNGETFDGVSFTKTFEADGSYSVKLFVRDNMNVTNSLEKSFSLANNLPTPVINCNTLGSLKLSCNGQSSTDTDGEIVSYSWEFDDGYTSSASQTDGHIFSSAGLHSIKLTVVDDMGSSASATKSFNVTEQNTAISCSQNGSMTLICSIIDSNSVDKVYLWDMGDGQTESGTSISHTYSTMGDKLIRVSVTGEGLSYTIEKNYQLEFSEDDGYSAGYFQIANYKETDFLPVTATVVVDIIGAKLDTDAAFDISVNGYPLSKRKFQISSSQIILSEFLLDGKNNLAIRGVDQSGANIEEVFTLYAGTRELHISVSDLVREKISEANVSVVLAENQSILTQGTVKDEEVVFFNIPLGVSLAITAQTNDGKFGSLFLDKANVSSTHQVIVNEINPLISSGNDDFSAGTDGWTIAKGSGQIISNPDEEVQKKGNALELSPDENGESILKRTIITDSGSKWLYWRFSVPGESPDDFYSVTFRNKTTGEVVYKCQTLKDYGFNDSSLPSSQNTWFEEGIPLSGGQNTVEVSLFYKKSFSSRGKSIQSKNNFFNITGSRGPIVSFSAQQSIYFKTALLKNSSYGIPVPGKKRYYDISGISLGTFKKEYFDYGLNKFKLVFSIIGDKTPDKDFILRIIDYKTHFADTIRFSVDVKKLQRNGRLSSVVILELPSKNLATIPDNVFIQLVGTYDKKEKLFKKTVFRYKNEKRVADYFPVMKDLSQDSAIINTRFSGRDDNVGGDAWTMSSLYPMIKAVLQSNPDMQYNDVSKMNGGDWNDHLGHLEGNEIDFRWAGSEFEKNQGGGTKLIQEEKTASRLVDFLNSDPVKGNIVKLLVSYCPNDKTSPFFSKINKLSEAYDKKYFNIIKSDIKVTDDDTYCSNLQNSPVHFNHFHATFSPSLSVSSSVARIPMLLRSGPLENGGYLIEFDTNPSTDGTQYSTSLDNIDFSLLDSNNPDARSALFYKIFGDFYIRASNSSIGAAGDSSFHICKRCLCSDYSQWGTMISSGLFKSINSVFAPTATGSSTNASLCGRSTVVGDIGLEDAYIVDSTVDNSKYKINGKIYDSDILNSKVFNIKGFFQSFRISGSFVNNIGLASGTSLGNNNKILNVSRFVDIEAPVIENNYLDNSKVSSVKTDVAFGAFGKNKFVAGATVDKISAMAISDNYISSSKMASVTASFASTNTLTENSLAEDIVLTDDSSFTNNKIYQSIVKTISGSKNFVSNTISSTSTISGFVDVSFSGNTIVNSEIKTVKNSIFSDNVITNESYLEAITSPVFYKNTFNKVTAFEIFGTFDNNTIDNSTIRNIKKEFSQNIISNATIDNCQMKNVKIEKGSYVNKFCTLSLQADSNGNYVSCTPLARDQNEDI